MGSNLFEEERKECVTAFVVKGKWNNWAYK